MADIIISDVNDGVDSPACHKDPGLRYECTVAQALLQNEQTDREEKCGYFELVGDTARRSNDRFRNVSL